MKFPRIKGTGFSLLLSGLVCSFPHSNAWSPKDTEFLHRGTCINLTGRPIAVCISRDGHYERLLLSAAYTSENVDCEAYLNEDGSAWKVYGISKIPWYVPHETVRKTWRPCLQQQ
jgi:hypothetical protein